MRTWTDLETAVTLVGATRSLVNSGIFAEEGVPCQYTQRTIHQDISRWAETLRRKAREDSH